MSAAITFFEQNQVNLFAIDLAAILIFHLRLRKKGSFLSMWQNILRVKSTGLENRVDIRFGFHLQRYSGIVTQY